MFSIVRTVVLNMGGTLLLVSPLQETAGETFQKYLSHYVEGFSGP